MKKQTRELYFQVLTELEKTISVDNIDSLKKLSNLIDNISNAEDQITLRDYYDNASNPVRSTNLVILACKHNKVKILEYLFDSDGKILNNLSIVTGRNTILPDDEDETCHNAFYYAIRSCNVELLDTLISKWPGKYFAVYLGELDTILSRAYEELKLKDVPLSAEMEIFVENKLVNLRFFSNGSRKDKNVKNCLNNIRERIELTLQNINLLKTDYSNAEKVDKRALFVAKFIAQNIYILKRQLNSTYDRLPWEEMEFCLVSFISSHTKRQEINLFYNATLNKSKILNHLENFAKKLEDIKDNIGSVNIGKFADLPKLKREKVVAEIISSYPQFEELYDDYQQIRDIHSLMKISDYIKLALSADPKRREGQLIITRVLQVIGEHLKNTLESPKLSNTTSELLLLSLPKNTREIIIDLRNSLSHAYSLSKRTEIEENTDVSFFTGVQNDTKRIDIVITAILYSKKIRTIRMLLKKIADSESSGEIKEIAEIFSNVKLDEMISENFKMMEYEKLEKLIKKLSDCITEKTNYENELFNKINNIISCAETRSENIQTDYITGYQLIKGLISLSENVKFDYNVIKGTKIFAKRTLENMTLKIKPHNLNEISELVMKIFRSVRLRIRDDNLARVNTLICEIFFYIPQFGTSDIRWIKKLSGMLNENASFISTYKQRKTYDITEEEYNNQLTLKLSELKSILSNNALSDQLIEKLPFFKNDKKLQTLVEMLVLDIMSILDTSEHYLENNLLFLDDNTPLLTGKCLRNHLAHDNALVDVLLSDPSIAVVLNAKKLTEGNIIKSKKKIGKLVSDNSFKLREKYNQDLDTITNQERMFAALEEENLESLKDCLKKGADINARNVNLWTTLHFAVKGPSLEVTKFILDQNLSVNVKDINGRTPLHVAAAHGRKNIVEFLIKEAGLDVDELDTNGKTPLHVATQNGHKGTVEVLLKNEANAIAQDNYGLSALHRAINNNHIDVVKILLKKDVNVDINETNGGFIPLHIAAERGHLELVNFLLQNNADVNVRNDEDWTPLHAAALYGHPEVVNALILKGADINARVISGCTPLHYAVENGHESIVNILLKHGANVNAVNIFYNSTPLLFAARDGHEGIVKALLKNKADASIATVTSYTPLHLAAAHGHLGIVVALLKHGVDICARAQNNSTPLDCSAAGGHKEVAEVLIKNGAKVNAKTTTNLTPLHVAAMRGHTDIINLLIKNKANVNAKSHGGMTPLHAAALNGHIDIIDLLIKSEAEIEAKAHDGIDLLIKDTSKINGKFYSGMTPLHFATLSGREDTIGFLIKHKANVNTRAINGFTPLHTAIVEGHKGIVNLLIKNKAQIDAKDFADNTPLHIAVQAGDKEIVEILAANGANVNVKNDNMTPLLSAIKCNYREIVEVLIASGANVNAEGIKCLSLPVLAGYSDIVEILLEKTYVDMKDPANADLLHWAAGRGHTDVVNALIARGADVDAITYDNLTPLCFAAQEGYEEIVEILIAGGANVNVKSTENVTPLHLAAVNGHDNVVKVLLDNKANINVKNNDDRTPDELAVARGHLQVIKLLMQYKKIDIVSKRNDDYTILHIASEESNLEMIKYLVDKGSDVNAKNIFGSKSIHIAAREGYKDTVEFFLSKGLSINDPGISNQTLLHYAAIKVNLEVAKYLISQGADVNAKDANGLTPMHVAANFGYRNFIEVLLKNGAVYNAVDNSSTRPLEMSDDESVIDLLTLTENLFSAAKLNDSSEIENYIKAGAVVNAKNAKGTSLHYAAWKGYDSIVNILLQNKADPNAVGNKGFTPLHYAAKISHLKVVKLLLSNGAVYNAVSDDGKTPSDFTVNKSITSLFKLLSDSFKHIKNDNSQVINDLNKIEDIDTVKAIMNACDRENKTLVVAAVHSNFSKVEQLKEVSQGDVSAQINLGIELFNRGDYQRALNFFKSAFERRKEILGSDNPGTLDIQMYIGQVSCAQGAYQESLSTFEDIFRKQKEILGLNDKNTLSTKSTIALMLHMLGRNEEAFNIYQEVVPKQEEVLGPNHLDTLDTYLHMALVLEEQGKYVEALNINRTILERRKEILGANHSTVMCVEHNIAMVLTNQGKYEEALKIYEEVFEKKKAVLGINHLSTLWTLHNMAGIFVSQKKFHKALIAFQEVFNIQKNSLGPNNPNTLLTQYNIANVLSAQGKWIGALKAFRECFNQLEAIFGPSHPTVLDILNKIEKINDILKYNDSGASEILQYLQKDINIAADTQIAQDVLRIVLNMSRMSSGLFSICPGCPGIFSGYLVVFQSQ
ncbi:uncharacterized protein [Temnothorax nylanderi]|uniref:uncharacterized protein n=1 Tax=Temnothorax nylanderi TaxID=102681 RepID=UPI003A857934